MSVRSIVRIMYCWLASGHYYNVIKEGGYDVVHIHGCGFYDEIYMNICKRLNQKYIVTLHGLNSFSDVIDLEPAGKRYEKDFLKQVVNGEFPITVISSGIKRTILRYYAMERCDNISVVCNSFSFENDESGEPEVDVKAKYNIPKNARLVLYMGNISRNKNQEQLIRAFELLPEKIKENTYILFCGRNIEQGYRLDEMVETSRSKDHLILCGNIDKDVLPDYYKQASAVVLLSIAEGFGLSLIEGMHFGLPCMTFEDLDAFDDIYDGCAVVGISSRKDESVKDGLIRLISQEWNKDKIMQHSKKFENEFMINQYIKNYKEVIYG